MPLADDGSTLITRVPLESQDTQAHSNAAVITVGEDDVSSDPDVQITHETLASDHLYGQWYSSDMYSNRRNLCSSQIIIKRIG